MRSVACGRRHSLALAQDGAVFSWGCGDDGALGHGDRLRRPRPRRVRHFQPDADPAARIACGSRHNAVATARGRLVCWGWAA